MQTFTSTRFAECVRAAGCDDFVATLIHALNEIVAIECALLLDVDPNGTPLSSCASHSAGPCFDPSSEASACTSVFGAWHAGERSAAGARVLHDPLLLHRSTHACVNRIVYGPVPMADRCFVVMPRGGDTAILGLYRRPGSRSFCNDDRDAIAAAIDVIAALADIHLRIGAVRNVPRDLEQAWNAGLSERERAVARLLARGETSRTIAAMLGVAPTSVITYKKRAFLKLGVTRQCELTALVGALD
ncbi:helix-turn-helix transcriptional regulator [Burkholderia latens]|uniref:helix-turn-helix transcriptional regulator n=1 Tax=Burkholderia latens TaxID=488446 RepID=UPI00158A2891|nr:LuxR family transcriptional regulator [Burkholderia latens]